MRWIALAIILASLPVFIAMLTKHRDRRNLALIAIGVMLFMAGSIQIDASIITWRLWPGTAKGIPISPVDTLALALIATRAGGASGLPFRGLLALYMIPVGLSIFMTTTPMAAFFVLAQLAKMMILLVAVGGELGRKGALRSLFLGISVGLTIQAGFVIEQKLSGVVQASGSLPHQNILGLMVELAVLPLIAAVLEGERHKLVYLGIVSGLIAVSGTGSRATMGIVAAAVVLLVLLSLIRRVTPRKLKIMGAGALMMALVVPLGLATLNDRFEGGAYVTQETQRDAFAEAARAMARDHPLGVGANGYVNVANVQGYSARAGVAWNETNRVSPVHNAYLLARAESGWAAQLALMAMILIPLVAGVRIAFADRRSTMGGIALGSAVAMVAVAIHNNYEYAWHVLQPQGLFFINLAIVAAAIRTSRLNNRAKAAKRRTASVREPTEPIVQAAQG